MDNRGPYTGSRKVHNPKPGGYKYDVTHPSTNRTCAPPVNGYRFPRVTMDAMLAEGRILFGDDEKQIIQIKEYLSDYEGRLSSVIVLDSRAGANEMEALFGDRKIFPHPKPSSLLRGIADFCLGRDDLVLDFFAGSGTTAHAVLDLNRSDGGGRRFILVQLPEPTARDDYTTISEITKERVRRVIQQRDEENAGQLNLAGARKEGCGFRVLKLAESNFRPWNADVPHEAPALAQQLELHAAHIREGRSADDILYEILLKSGFTLTMPIEKLALAGKSIHSVADGTLLVCLERELTLDLIRAVAKRKPARVVCLDEGFSGNDQLKANAVQIFRNMGVTSFKTV